MRRSPLILALILSGCVATPPLSGRGAQIRTVDLLVYPKFNPYTQAVVLPLSLSNIATLDIVPCLQTSPGVYSPISSVTGNPVPFSDADVLKLTQASPSIDPNRPFILRKLKPNSTYRIFGKAYNMTNSLISQDNSSYTDVVLTSNDAPTMANLPINLMDTPFAATTSVTINASGRYDYLKTALYLVSNNSQVALSQSTRYTPTITFENLQGNSTYRLEAEAYKLGIMVASTSQNLVISTDNAPAAQSMSMSVPYLASTLAGGAGSTALGYTDGVGTAAKFNNPYGVAVDAAGNVYIADYGNSLIRKISSTGIVSTLAGGAGATASGYADGMGTAAKFGNPRNLAVDGAGNLYVADTWNHLIRKITSAGAVSTLAGGYGYADGTGTAAKFYNPCGVAVDGAGNVYVSDTWNHLIRKITSSGVVSTLAGGAGGTTSGYADGMGIAAKFYWPAGIAVDGPGNVYVVDNGNNLIRKITSAGSVSTLAGGGGGVLAGYADGTGTAAKFNTPFGIAVDGFGNVYVGDYANHLIRKITSNGVVSTLSGGAGATTSGYANGTGTAAKFNNPSGIAVDGLGFVYVGDYSNNLIRVLK